MQNSGSALQEAPSLSMVGRYPPDISTRKVAVLTANGMDMIAVRRVMQELTDAGAQCKVVAPHLGHIGTASGRTVAVGFTFSNTSSVMFDAVLLPGGAASADELCRLGSALHFVLEAYKHCKPICAINEGVRLLGSLGFAMSQHKNTVVTQPTPGVVIADSQRAIEGEISQAFISAMLSHRHWDRINLDSVPA
jgi:catalase